jgi:hypothetical protein
MRAAGSGWIVGLAAVAVAVAVVLAVAAVATAGVIKADALTAAITAQPVSNARNLTVELPGRSFARIRASCPIVPHAPKADDEQLSNFLTPIFLK